MDFEGAAARLARDQLKARGRKGVTLSEKAKKQAEFQKKQQANLRAERERKRQIEHYQRHYMHQCEFSLKEKAIGEAGSSLVLQPTSIHGDGDKIALPPSVLETLTSASWSANDMLGGGNPWTFRIGILNPQYKFPESPLVQILMPPKEEDMEVNMDVDDDSSDSEDEEKDQHAKEAFLDELGHKYLSYTHCTVVEFTQEEGHVGIPRHIAAALLDPKNRHPNVFNIEIPITRTVDPATGSMTDEKDDASPETPEAKSDVTPGHLAWSAFDIPDVKLEITMVKLPKGRGCTLTPTKEAVENNFYGLKDVKLVLEQSLIRTRATLSLGDSISTWSRGVRFDLVVSKIAPATYHAVTCINTDIEVDIGEIQSEEKMPANSQSPVNGAAETKATETGFRLGSGKSLALSTPSLFSAKTSTQDSTMALLPEPPREQNENVCTIQIRYSGGQGKRRFAVDTARVMDLFAFAASLMNRCDSAFQLVTRFPRRELRMDAGNKNQLLQDAGIQQGQELFLVEISQ
jgi:hypothetical protein